MCYDRGYAKRRELRLGIMGYGGMGMSVSM